MASSLTPNLNLPLIPGPGLPVPRTLPVTLPVPVRVTVTGTLRATGSGRRLSLRRARQAIVTLAGPASVTSLIRVRPGPA
eukprot:1681300-Rhodomonas_salina.3